MRTDERLRTLTRYTITSEGASKGYFRLVVDEAGQWVTWPEIEAVLAELAAPAPQEAVFMERGAESGERQDASGNTMRDVERYHECLIFHHQRIGIVVTMDMKHWKVIKAWIHAFRLVNNVALRHIALKNIRDVQSVG